MLYNIELKTIFLSLGLMILSILLLSKPFKRWIANKNPDIRINISSKEYYYINEKGNKTYYNQLKWVRFLNFITLSFFLFVSLGLVWVFFRNYEHSYLLFFIINCLAGFFFVQIVLFSYFTFIVLFYYLIPLVLLFFLLVLLNYNVELVLITESKVMLILLSFVAYCIMIFSIPIPNNRKLLSVSVLLDALIAILIGLFLEENIAKIEIFFYNQVSTNANIKAYITEFLSLFNENSMFEGLSLFKKTILGIPEFISYIKKMKFIYILQNMEKILGVSKNITFILFSSYSIARILVGLKIKIGEAKAKDIYEKIENQENVAYEDLRDCIFYGGEKYQDKICSNPEYKKTIISTEQGFEFYVEKRKWVIGISHFTQNVVEFLKKLI